MLHLTKGIELTYISTRPVRRWDTQEIAETLESCDQNSEVYILDINLKHILDL